MVEMYEKTSASKGNRPVAVVTGANRGLGRAIALRFAQGGYDVFAASRSASNAGASEYALERTGETIKSVVCDVTRYDDVDGLVTRVLRERGRLDVFVNNAGIIEPMTLLEQSDPEAWETNVRTNLTGVYYGCRAALPRMVRAGGGIIVNVSSGAAHRPLKRWSAYCAAKAGVAMLIRSIALETEGRGILVYGFQPGVVKTGMQKQIRRRYVNEVSALPEEALLDPAIPADVVFKLCRLAPKDLNGHDVSIRDAAFLGRLGMDPVVT